MSLIQELEKRTGQKKKIVIISISVIIVIIAMYYLGTKLFASTSGETDGSAQPYTIKKGNISIGLSAEGQIKGDNVLTLGFEVNGKITSIAKNIGEKVKQGEVIATVDSSSTINELKRAQNSLQQTILNYNTRVKPLSALEVEQIQGNLQINTLNYQSKKMGYQSDLIINDKSVSDLETKITNLKKDIKRLLAGETLEQKVNEQTQQVTQKQKDLSLQISDLNQKIKDGLLVIDEFLGISNSNATKNDSFEHLIGAKDFYALSKAKSLRTELSSVSLINTTDSTGDEFINILDQAGKAAEKLYELASVMNDVMNDTVEGSDLTASNIQSYKNIFSSLYSSAYSKYQAFINGKESYKILLTNAAASISNTQLSLEEQKESLEEQLKQTEKDLSYAKQQADSQRQQTENALKINDQQSTNDLIDYQLKVNPLSADDKSIYRLQIEAARISVAEKQLQLEKTQLKSPVDGVILTIDGYAGNTAPSNFITIATKGYTYIEINLDEEEINSIQEGQIAYITPDSVEDLTFTGEVYYIASVGNTDNNGLVTYPVYIKYHTSDERVKTAMKVEVNFIQKQADDVIIVPVKSVFAYQNQPHVRMQDGSLRKVVTGLSDGKYTEIINGLKEGEVILSK